MAGTSLRSGWAYKLSLFEVFGGRRSFIAVLVLLSCFLLLLYYEVYGLDAVVSYSASKNPSIGAALSSPSHTARLQKVAVFGVLKDQDADWANFLPLGWSAAKYIMDDPTAALSVPRNQGREGAAYLTFIIDNYDDLPEYMAFIHGHERGWHQPEPIQYILSALNLTALDVDGFVNLRCTLFPWCYEDRWRETEHVAAEVTPDGPPRAWLSVLMRGLHSYVFRPGDPWYDESIPENKGVRIPKQFKYVGGGQFAVTRDLVRSKSLAYWKRVREPLTRDMEELEALWWPGVTEMNRQQFYGLNSWNLGAAYEAMWHYLFGMGAKHCVSIEHCTRVIFQDLVHCNETTGPYTGDDGWQNIKCEFKGKQDWNDSPIGTAAK